MVDEQDLMFGSLNQNNIDGIFTNACKKANKVRAIPEFARMGWGWVQNRWLI